MTDLRAPTRSTIPSAWSAPRYLLAAGVLAGPLYVSVSLTQALTRAGFDLTRHPWSALANGDLRWIQMANLAVTGLLLIALAIGLHGVLGAGPASRWGPRGLATFGAGMFAAAFFRADPTLGFPPGTPSDYREMSVHGILHMLSATIGFIGAVTACLVLARRFAWNGERVWAVTSRLVAGFFLVSFVGLSATGASVGIIAFTLGVVLLFAWIAAVAVRHLGAVPRGDVS